jgi:hypothetical protein
MDPNGQHLPFSGENLLWKKISKQKLGGNAAKNN